MARITLSLSCKDQIGIVAKVATFLSANGGFIIESAQFGDPDTGRFFMRTLFNETNENKRGVEEWENAFSSIAQEFAMDFKFRSSEAKAKVVILASKAPHCLNQILNLYSVGDLRIEVPAVISNHDDLRALCNFYHIPFYHLPMDKEGKAAQEEKLYAIIERYQPDLVVLARYMQILSPGLTNKLYGKAINIHHSFLPSFKGAKPYHQAYEKGVKLIGATAHYVSDDLDEGPIIEQEVVRVDHNYTPEKLVQCGRDVESLSLVRAIKYHIEDRVFINGHKTVVFR
ncbi:formyltetrahydrofolate deformylase [Estrella lausannensis]|uniref:Formyltetrahydrofolate deformylase n=1 Tax=Estrella lausannensis TaxID=483423 RepID=A0A0H5DTF5_9BACT|nr:formyltetrahydrofolate deformylase [Estrella lausannensis]CRX39119.1 Formyltetrahydrofolate deformylase [Estrella lausannensis]